MRGSAAALRDSAGDRPLVVGVDDAQLLDPVSAALVLHLASAAATFVLATVRTGEPCPDAIVSLWKDAGAQRLELAALSDRETDEMVESIVGGPVEEGALRWAWETSRGNPLYVRELVLGALGGGALAQVSGLWRMPARPPISASLTELISARMAGLADGERRVLELLALGEPLTVDALAELVGVDAVVSTEARGLVSIDAARAGQQARLSHPLYGEAIRSSLPSLRAREIRLTLADRIQAQGELAAGDSLRAARLLLDAGASIPTRLLIDAARSANLSGDPDLGAELSARALGAGGGAQAGLLLARAEQVRKRFAEAESRTSADSSGTRGPCWTRGCSSATNPQPEWVRPRWERSRRFTGDDTALVRAVKRCDDALHGEDPCPISCRTSFVRGRGPLTRGTIVLRRSACCPRRRRRWPACPCTRRSCDAMRCDAAPRHVASPRP
ncbi:MAG: hypothetical protein ACLP50_31935 [Solirubrobacteraceae bacterium]